jgi:uncharacterized surface protein with fasciclin (FAS1) repeats
MQNGKSSKFIKMVASITVGSTAILVLVPAMTQATPGNNPVEHIAQASPAAPANIPPVPTQLPSPGGQMTAPGQMQMPPTSTPDAQTPVSPAAPTTAAPAATESPAAPAAAGNTVVDVATSAGSFNTLTRAIEAAGLTETLRGEGPFTVFAPTDEAFAALPPGTLESLLKPENREKLVKVLTYHVVSGRVTSGDLKAGAVTTLEGSSATVTLNSDKVQVNNASVTRADVMASNGVIHVIDRVLLPPNL